MWRSSHCARRNRLMPVPAFLRLIALSLLILAIPQTGAAQWQQQSSGTTADFRGLSVVNDKIVWASGTKGAFIRTVDGGTLWQVGAVPGAEQLDFRDVDAFDADTAYLLSAGKGENSRIYKTTDGGKQWTLQFKNTNPEAFFDAMAFWDARHGIAMSDPVDGRFLIITTDDGGATWKQILAQNMPPALPDEAGFAASGTCIAVDGARNVWFGTGGASRARVFRSTDGGQIWAVADTPILAGAGSAGVFSIAFKDAKHGVVVGGDYQKPNQVDRNIAITADGGLTWKLSENSKPKGFRSAIAYVRRGRGDALVAVGTSGSDYSSNGADWMNLDEQNYNAVS